MKKKILSVILAIFTMVSMVSVMPAAADTTVTAKYTASKIDVNGLDGKVFAFKTYNIDGSDYFKLRDLAYALNGTEKQFDVGWENAKNAISLTSGKPYTAVGGEMSDNGTGDKTAAPTTSKIYLDGKEISLTAYNIDGNNYFKLLDIGHAFNFNVDWNWNESIPAIYTNQIYRAGREFAGMFGSYFGGTSNPDNRGVVEYYDTGNEKIKFETIPDETTEDYVLKINDHAVNMTFLWFDQIIVTDDFVIITTAGTDIRATQLYVFDFNGNTLFNTYYLNNKGMVIQPPIFTDGNNILMHGTRFTHGIDLYMKSEGSELSGYADYLYQDTVYDYANLKYDYYDYEVYLYNGKTLSEEAAILNKAEIVEADFELDYLGGGKFDKIKMTGNIKTLGDYLEEIAATTGG
ncbi:MAG: hypothetical protein FWD71_13665 [Oscillospiraceae bacterium]|nr:hypothetical protein [Oscillospiraceae bacterium]